MMYKIIVPLLLLFVLHELYSQDEITPKDYSVNINVNIIDFDGKPVVEISWPTSEETIFTEIRKKSCDTNKFESFDAFYGLDSIAIDTSIQVGKCYEYRIERFDLNNSAWGYTCVGVDIPPVDYRGKLLLVVDSLTNQELTSEIERLEFDLIGDGWLVERIVSPRANEFSSEKVEQTKNLINQSIINSKQEVVTIFILGRVPVPYSGDFSPDGHADHVGAWPADAYYGINSLDWLDIEISNDISIDERNHNFPGDGKYDNSLLPGILPYQMGRVDLYNLPDFEETDIELIRRYLNKNHNFRHQEFVVDDIAFIDDKFGMYTNEAFASNAWLNFFSMMGEDKIEEIDLRTNLPLRSCLWSYGCNQGGFNSCLLTAYSNEYATLPQNSIFTLLFGSWFGDWDCENNILRAGLASSPSILTAAWSGRPFWHFHHMALGYPIGYSMNISINNSGQYMSSGSYGYNHLHINLLGDPSLRMHVVAPVQDVATTEYRDNSDPRGIQINWQHSSDDIIGYNIYRSQDYSEKFERINNEIITDNEYIDYKPVLGRNIYMVRAVKNQVTPAGNFYNMSQGIFSEFDFFPILDEKEALNAVIVPNPTINYANVVVYLPEQTHLTISVYDETGRKLSNIYEGIADKGYNIYNWDLISNEASISSGIYFISIATDNATITQSIVIIK